MNFPADGCILVEDGSFDCRTFPQPPPGYVFGS
jgi:hypothetical protein